MKENEKSQKKEPAKAVIFVENTENSKLASEMRKVVQEMRPWTNLNIKIVERTGDKIQDTLCKSDPWGNMDCKREGCCSCESTVKHDKPRFKTCFQRSIVYETWCNTCLEKEKKRISEIKENIENTPD